MNDTQIKYMVDRFLCWKLPKNFSPDGGVSFEKYGNKGTGHEYEHEPVGTNLLDATQAEAMVRHLIDGLPRADDPESSKLVAFFREPESYRHFGWHGDQAGRSPAETAIHELRKVLEQKEIHS